MKKIKLMLSIFSLALILTACGSNNGENTQVEESSNNVNFAEDKNNGENNGNSSNSELDNYPKGLAISKEFILINKDNNQGLFKLDNGNLSAGKSYKLDLSEEEIDSLIEKSSNGDNQDITTLEDDSMTMGDKFKGEHITYNNFQKILDNYSQRNIVLVDSRDKNAFESNPYEIDGFNIYNITVESLGLKDNSLEITSEVQRIINNFEDVDIIVVFGGSNLQNSIVAKRLVVVSDALVSLHTDVPKQD